jgi:hypothetical protein
MRIHPALLTTLAGIALLVTAGCQPRPPAPQLSPDPGLNAFVQELEQALETHAWNDVLEVADPSHRRVQVTEHGMPEPQYVAELFGLHRVGNDIRRGPGVTWSDLERIEAVEFHELSPAGDRYDLTGEVRLDGGETLRLHAWIVRIDGRFRLTGAFG